jgi:hypothetical protein
MPEITSENITIAIDMHGCPNRCRHCWLGYPPSEKITKKDVKDIAFQFRQYIQSHSILKNLTVATWVWEPDFSPEYKELYHLEKELSDGDPHRFELLSVVRLARDKEYAEWARSVGPDTCQITLFGTEKTTDWFYRRKGAFKDCIKATEQLLDVGMKPRWQLFLTTKILPELKDLLELIDTLKLRERVQSLGAEFELFIHTPGPDGEARHIEYLRPTLKDTDLIPQELITASKAHFGTENLWYTEGELISHITKEENLYHEYVNPPIFAFYITQTQDVFSNMGTLEPWWKLGNLKTDSVPKIFDRFENNACLGFKTLYTISPKTLAKKYGNLKSTKIYTDKEDLEALYVAQYCESIYKS